MVLLNKNVGDRPDYAEVSQEFMETLVGEKLPPAKDYVEQFYRKEYAEIYTDE